MSNDAAKDLLLKLIKKDMREFLQSRHDINSLDKDVLVAQIANGFEQVYWPKVCAKLSHDQQLKFARSHGDELVETFEKVFVEKFGASSSTTPIGPTLEAFEPIRPKLVTIAPGGTLLLVSNLVFSKRFMETVVKPVIADMREECFEALSRGDVWAARRARVHGTYSFFAAIGLDRAFAFVSFFIKAWKSVN